MYSIKDVPSPAKAPVVNTPYMAYINAQKAKEAARLAEEKNPNSSSADSSPKSKNQKDKKAEEQFVLKEPVQLANILHLERPHRAALKAGSKLQVFIGDELVMSISKNLLMTVSSVAQAAHDNKQDSIRLSKDLVSKDSVSYLLKWLIRVCHVKNTFRIPARANNIASIELLHTAHLLGFLDDLTAHIYRDMMNYISKSVPTYEELDAILKFAESNNEEPLFGKVVSRLTHLRYHNEIEDPEDFEEYLSEHPILANAMDATDSYFAAKRAEREATKARAAKAHQRRIEKQERKDAKTAAAVKQKLNATSNVKTMTAEEAEFLRSRR